MRDRGREEEGGRSRMEGEREGGRGREGGREGRGIEGGRRRREGEREGGIEGGRREGGREGGREEEQDLKSGLESHYLHKAYSKTCLKWSLSKAATSLLWSLLLVP